MQANPSRPTISNYLLCLVQVVVESIGRVFAVPTSRTASLASSQLDSTARREFRPPATWQRPEPWLTARPRGLSVPRRIALAWCLGASLLVGLSVVGRVVSPLVLVGYLSALAAGYAFLRETPLARLCCWPTRAEWTILLPLILVQLICLQYFASLPFHYMQDEFITAYASYNLPSLSHLDWFGAFPSKGQWVTQFPVLFFLLQKPVLVLLGPSVESIKVSTWPYEILVVVFLYLLARELFASRTAAAGTVVVYLALAPNLYISSYGVHFISSTLFFLASFYFLVLLRRRRERTYALLCGIVAALAYLTYTASYLTIPLLLSFVALDALWQRSLRPFRSFVPALAIWAVALFPFALYAATQTNYFVNRTDQVNLLGLLKQELGKPGGTGAAWATLSKQVATNVESLYTAGPGGVTDFWFGHQALFNPLTFGLLLLGLLAAVVAALVGKRRERLFLVVVVVATFVFGMVLTLPPGAFHRTSLAFPFVALLIVLGIQTITAGLERSGGTRRVGSVAFTVGVAIVAVANFQSAVAMAHADEQISAQKDDRYVGQYLEASFPAGTSIYIAADPSYHLQRELFFRTNDRYVIKTDDFSRVADRLGASPLIVLDPTPSQRQFLLLRYPDGKIVEQVDGHPLEHLLIFLPRGSPS